DYYCEVYDGSTNILF
nr:immunoglobulin light chain junction region [Macaca mulatta]MOX28845.1 immunoglobulin light chain junction region [Macaca mulatta]MOX29543.1 immunoglobulin light chain junction region [Macaca mulatta]MOX31446.1 immunoglobulin light chain junction region [Macaca mulatta]MOX32316.1 immunoglobulin light chain junction region [Macaca mulatta]